MSNVAQHGSVRTTFTTNNSAYNHIEGNGNAVNINNSQNSQNISIISSSGTHVNPSVIIENALGKHHVPGAAFAAQSDIGCMPGTRVQFLVDVLALLKTRSGPRIAWVTGMAGTGKTSIAVTLCQQLLVDPSVRLGGAFFCSRSAGSIERTDVRRIIPTLAANLARQLPIYASALVKSLEEEPETAHRSIRTQIDGLLKQPLESLAPLSTQIVFVIDALDECSDQGKLTELLNALVSFNDGIEVKFLLTSRPEMHIRESPISDPSLSSILRLHTIDTSQVMEDIRLYISKTLEQISPSVSWYTAGDIESLVQMSAGLFIYAATVLKYIRDRGTVKGRQERLRKATSAAKASHAAIASVDSIYEFILIEASRSDNVDEDELLATQHALACVLTVRSSISVEALAELIGIEVDDLRECLDRLHSVVYLPPDNETPGVRTLHASFGDYLLDRAPQNLRILQSLGDEILARGCLRVMAKRLHFNVAQSLSSYLPNSTTRPKELALSLEYACLQWIHHIASLPEPSMFDEEIAKIFRRGFLFWLEVLSILGHVRRASAMLIFAAATVNHPQLSRFLRDANVFVASSHEAIERSVPHIYLSALPFAAKDTLVYEDFATLCNGVVSAQTSGISRHSGRLVMTFTGHENSTEAVAHSPDGHILASGSRDGTVRLWDMRTGVQVMLPLQRDAGWVHSVSFAPDGKRLASGTVSGVIHIWDVTSGMEVFHPLSGHSAAILSVSFSPNSRVIASASADRTVRLWDAATGTTHILLKGHKGWVRAIAFLPDGKILASGSNDRTIRLWHVDTGEPAAQALCMNHMGISSVCFSPDGTTLASSSYDGNIRLWAWRTGENVVTLRGHSDSVHCIRFSPDGQFIVSASSDATVCLWDLRKGHAHISSVILGSHSGPVNAVSYSPNGLYVASASDDSTIRMWHAGDSHLTLQPLSAHTAGVNSVAVSSDGTFLVSGSDDRSVRVWDAQTGSTKLQPLLGHEGEVYSVAVSSDGRLIASGSADCTIRLWDAQTGTTVGAPRDCRHEVRQVAFSPDTQWLASGSVDGTVSIWDIETWLPTSFSPLSCIGDPHGKHLTPCTPPRLFSVDFSPSGEHLAVGTFEAYVRLWNVATGQPTDPPLRANLDVIIGRLSESQLHAAICRLPLLKLNAIASRLCESELRAVIGQLPKPDLCTVIRWLPDSGLSTVIERLPETDLRVVVNQLPESDLRAAISRLSSSELTVIVDRLPRSNTHALFNLSPDSDLHVVIARLSESDLGVIVNWMSKSELRTIVGRLPQPNAYMVIGQLPYVDLCMAIAGLSESDLGVIVSWLPESDLRAAIIQLSEADLRAVIGQLPKSDLCAAISRLPELEMSDILLLWREGIRSIAFSPDGTKIVTGVENGTVYVWDMNCSSQIVALLAHSGSVSAVAYSPNGRIIASGSEDTTVRLWNADSGQAMGTWHGHTQQIRSVAFTPDGLSVVSGADDGTIRIWHADLVPNSSVRDVNDPFDSLARARRDRGWLVGSSGELLLWVPQEYQGNLVMGNRCTNLIASHRVFLSAGNSGLHIGHNWVNCWSGPDTLQPL